MLKWIKKNVVRKLPKFVQWYMLPATFTGYTPDEIEMTYEHTLGDPHPDDIADLASKSRLSDWTEEDSDARRQTFNLNCNKDVKMVGSRHGCDYDLSFKGKVLANVTILNDKIKNVQKYNLQIVYSS